MRKINKILVCIFLAVFICSFNSSWKELANIEIQAKIMEVDNLGNIYLVSKTNQLYKYNSKGELLSTLNYSYLGNISHLDCSNPMEVFMFYKELNTLVFLDNNLAFRGKINLSEIGTIQATAMGRAYDNSIWLFDISDLQLKKVERDGKVTQQSGNSLQFLTKNKLSPLIIRENGNQVFMNDTAIGILVFDVFANYLKTIPVKGVTDFSANEKELIYLDASSLIRYNYREKTRLGLQLPDIERLSVKMFKQNVYILDSTKLHIYSFE